MANRTTFNGASTGVPWRDNAENPEGFGAQYARHIGTLYDASALPLTAVGGSADDVLATVDPVLDGPLVDGMKFTLTWALTNSGPMTLKIGPSPAAPVIGADGSVMIAGGAKSGTRALLEFIGGAYRILSGGGEAGGSASYHWVLAASGDWVKPAGLDDNRIIVVELWGGGGGGTARQGSWWASGGGGGGYFRLEIRAVDCPSLVPVQVGAGGGHRGKGGDSSFGDLATALGGGGAPQPTSGGSAGGTQGGPKGYGGGSDWSGGGLFGGAPGGSSPQITLGLFGGNGGNGQGVPGTAPGGGGGSQPANGGNWSPGARGEVRIWIS